jgi:hypothetical protein
VFEYYPQYYHKTDKVRCCSAVSYSTRLYPALLRPALPCLALAC